MWDRVRRFLRLSGAPPQGGLPPPASVAAPETADALQKLTRVQARSALRLEEIERKLDQVGGAVGLLVARPAHAPTPVEGDLSVIFDAMDLLEEAAHTTRSSELEGLGEGLRGVLARLDSFLAGRGCSRITPYGLPPDASLFRVVGTECRPEVAEGAVSRVVRAAVRRGDRLVREGEVITHRGEPA